MCMKFEADLGYTRLCLIRERQDGRGEEGRKMEKGGSRRRGKEGAQRSKERRREEEEGKGRGRGTPT